METNLKEKDDDDGIQGSRMEQVHDDDEVQEARLEQVHDDGEAQEAKVEHVHHGEDDLVVHSDPVQEGNAPQEQ